MSIEKKCMDCSVIIVDEWFFACHGFMCNKVISYNCAVRDAKKLLSKFPNDVKKAIKIVMDGVPGLHWFCPECMVNNRCSLSKIDSTMKRMEQTEATLMNAIQAVTNFSKSVERIEKDEVSVLSAIRGIPVNPKTVPDRRITRSQSQAASQVIPMPTTSTSALTSEQTDIQSQSHPKVTGNTQLSIILPHLDDQDTINVVKNKLQMNDSPSIEVNSTEHQASSTRKKTEPSIPDDKDTISVVKPRRWLFISRIDPSVTDDQFKRFIMNKFHLQVINAIRMVPKARNGYNLNYISYRLSVNETSFASVATSKYWPAGIFIKEFDFTQRKAFLRNTGPSNVTT